MRKLLAAGLLFASVSAVAATSNTGPIRPHAIRAHMRLLASDALEGRGPGTRGYDLAAEYVATQFELLGLTPGNGDSYLQNVPLRTTLAAAEGSSVTIDRGGESTQLRLGEGFMTVGDPFRTRSTASGEVVFAGYGVTAPAAKYDDYAGLDVRGKLVVVLSGAPAAMASDLRAHYSASLTKVNNAADRGALGLFVIQTPQDSVTYPWDRLVRQQRQGGMNWVGPTGQPSGARSELAIPHVFLSHAAGRALFTGGRMPLDDVFKAAVAGNVKGFALPARASVNVVTEHGRVDSPNVVAIFRGSDPKLRDEYVVFSSHLDHLGISDPVDGDRINNGALDNASGIAAMLEIARALSVATTKPKRSILFVATTAEEKGLRGADYFANNPTVPVDKIVANVNIDEFLMFVPTRDVTPVGAEHSTIEDAARKVAKRLGVELSPDPFPQEVIFVRSDQYPFIKRGIPAVFLIAGYKAVDPKHDVLELQHAWLRERYHTPKDDMSQPMDFSVGAFVTNFAYELGLELANGPRPRWKPGDFFGETFGR